MNQQRRDDRLAFSAARELVRRRSMDFYLACSFLPKPKRDAVYAANAFCLMIEQAMKQEEHGDSIQCSSDSTDGRIVLLREKLENIYGARVELPNAEFRTQDQHVLLAMLLTVQRFEIPRELVLEFADGLVLMSKQSRIATWSSLEKCLSAGSAVARIIGCILGATHSDAGIFAARMGMAIQFTRILTSLKSDAAAGQIWLPLEDLARFRYTQRELTEGLTNDAFRQLIQFEIQRARNLVKEGAEGICWLAGDGSRVMASTVAALNVAMLDAIDARKDDILQEPTRLTLTQKLARLPRAWRLARREPGDPMPQVF